MGSKKELENELETDLNNGLKNGSESAFSADWNARMVDRVVNTETKDDDENCTEFINVQFDELQKKYVKIESKNGFEDYDQYELGETADAEAVLDAIQTLNAQKRRNDNGNGVQN